MNQSKINLSEEENQNLVHIIEEKHENLKSYIFYKAHAEDVFEKSTSDYKKWALGKKYAKIGDFLINQRALNYDTLLQH